MSDTETSSQKILSWVIVVLVLFVLFLLFGFWLWSLALKRPNTTIELTRQDLAQVTFWSRKSDLRALAAAKGCGTIILPITLDELAAEKIVATCSPTD